MSKLAHSNEETMDMIDRQHTIESGNEDLLPDYPAHLCWNAIWTEIRASKDLRVALRKVSIHEIRTMLGIFAKTVCKPPVFERQGFDAVVFPSTVTDGRWVAEAINLDGDGEVFHVTFSGPNAKRHAIEYAEAKYRAYRVEP